jgi:hypothetical protein
MPELLHSSSPTEVERQHETLGVVRFEGAPGWADAALPTRSVRFAPRRTRTAHRPS